MWVYFVCGMFFLYFDTWSMCVFDTSRKKNARDCHDMPQANILWSLYYCLCSYVYACQELLWCEHLSFVGKTKYFSILLKLFDLQNLKHRRLYNFILSKTFINYSVVYHPNLKACRMSHVDTRCNATFDKIKNCWKGFMTFFNQFCVFMCMYVLNEIIWCYLGGMWSVLKCASLSK